MSYVALHAVVHGRVQGVGFRYFVLHRARELGVDGYVRNLADGSVEVYAEGDRATLEALREILARGPEFAAVSRVEASYGTPRRMIHGFTIR